MIPTGVLILLSIKRRQRHGSTVPTHGRHSINIGFQQGQSCLQTHDAPTEPHNGKDRKRTVNQGKRHRNPRQFPEENRESAAQIIPLGRALSSRFLPHTCSCLTITICISLSITRTLNLFPLSGVMSLQRALPFRFDKVQGGEWWPHASSLVSRG